MIYIEASLTVSETVQSRILSQHVNSTNQTFPGFSNNYRFFLGQIRCSRATNEDQRLALCKLLYLFGFVQEVQAGLTAGSFQARFISMHFDI